MAPYLPLLLLPLLLFLRLSDLVRGTTDSSDVSALNVMYSSLSSPSKLTGWSSGGGDPCGNDWKGIKCSGSSVTEM
ncbi:hypothetical protein GW17_00043857 [Ensete ventricosum]|nr:hypothetical protein GW17_00043857 [Ensete ventricosum]